ncbi:MAG: hypothetical protein ACT6Q5_11215 [Sphingopyxis solisilvae]|uniref:hypothetical protein n=1 Tax=Sphingopyxis solisilvae TaxID=1886788 RepID=UPI004036919C
MMRTIFSFLLGAALATPVVLNAQEPMPSTAFACMFVREGEKMPGMPLTVLLKSYQEGEQMTYALSTKDPANLVGDRPLKFFDFKLKEKANTPIFAMRSDEKLENGSLLVVSSFEPQKFSKIGDKDQEVFQANLGFVSGAKDMKSGWCGVFVGDGADDYYDNYAPNEVTVK